MLDKFIEQGYIHLEQIIPQDLLREVRSRSIKLKNKYKGFAGSPRHNGSGEFWDGLELASTLDPNLWKVYTSKFMFDISKELLQTYKNNLSLLKSYSVNRGLRFTFKNLYEDFKRVCKQVKSTLNL